MVQITAVPAYRDNYIWAIHAARAGEHVAVLVDPGEPGAILAWLADTQVRPVAVLITHHHGDHTGALAALAQHWDMPVYGPRAEAIAGVNRAVGEGDAIDIPEIGLHFQVLATPGHTRGHICYTGAGRLFCGDTLFSCGCGRLFEGTAEQLYTSLGRLARLPPQTEVYCAHEYTLPNIAFALEVEPDNPALAARHLQARQARAAGLPTLPGNIGQELACNPFLRCHLPSLRAVLAQRLGLAEITPLQAFTALRRWKDDY